MCKMAHNMTSLLTFLVLLSISFVYVSGIQWPVPYQRFPGRPPANPYCHAGVIPFCPTGRPNGSMPEVEDSDIMEVFALKAPVWEFKFGDLLAKFHIIHDAMGFRNQRTGHNYTMEWYELFQLFNCTFAHLLPNNTLKWCNQGAACIYDGIDDIHWSQNGTLVKIGEMTGSSFKKFSTWAVWDNNTAIYYETWTVWQQPGGKMWFDSFDCASFVLRALNKMSEFGTKFDHSIHLNYTRINLYSEEPQFLGNASTIFGPSGNKTLAKDILAFYKHFQSHQSIGSLIESLIDVFKLVEMEHKFYFFYNFEYWFLPMQEPFVKLTFDEVPLPKNSDENLYFEPEIHDLL